jgi:peptide chain release factor 2
LFHCHLSNKKRNNISFSSTTTLHASKTNNNKETTSSKTIDLPTLKRLVTQSTSLHTQNIASTIPYDQIQSRLQDLETETSSPSFWDASNSDRSEVVTREIGRYTRLKGEMEGWERLRGDALGALELLQDLLDGSSGGDNFEEDEDEMILLTFEECQSSAQKLLEQSQKYELQTLLSGPYDSAQCTLQLTAGAGGTEACDWVSMLYRMYMRHAQFMDYKVTVLEESVGDVVGYKSVELLVEGVNAYGWFKGEKGA